MSITPHVKTILDSCGSDTGSTRAKQSGAGRLAMLPADPGFKHGPARSSASNPAGDPIMDRNTVGHPMEDAPFPHRTATGLFKQATR